MKSQQGAPPSKQKLPKKNKSKTSSRVLRTFCSTVKIFGIFSSVLVAVVAIALCTLPADVSKDLAHAFFRKLLFTTKNLYSGISDRLGYGTYLMNIEKFQFPAEMPEEDPPSASFGGVKTSRIYIDDVPVLVHRPIGLDSNAPAVVFTHGGGFALLNVDLFDGTMYKISTEANLVSFSIQMRKPPAHPFPAGVNDCIAVTRHLLKHGAKYGIDSTRVGLIGESSGATLASAIAWNISHEASQGLLPPVRFVALHFPMLQGFHMLSSSHVDYFDIFSISNARDIGGYFALYAGIALKDVERAARAISENRHIPPEMLKNSKYAKYVDSSNLPEEFRSPKKPIPDFKEPFDAEISSMFLDKLTDPNFSPFMADDLSRFPETFIYAVEKDYSRDDALLFHKRLLEAGVKSDLYLDRDAFHGNFVLMKPDFLNPPCVERSINLSINFIKRVLGSDQT